MRRRIFLALAASALLITGCQGVVDAADPPPTPAEKLRDAVPDGSQGSFRYTMKQLEGDAKGEVNPKDKRMTYTAVFKDKDLGFSMTMAIVVIDQQAWTKVTFSDTKGITGLPKLPPKWLELDTSKVDDPEDVDDAGATGGVRPAERLGRDRGLLLEGSPTGGLHGRRRLGRAPAHRRAAEGARRRRRREDELAVADSILPELERADHSGHRGSPHVRNGRKATDAEATPPRKVASPNGLAPTG